MGSKESLKWKIKCELIIIVIELINNRDDNGRQKKAASKIIKNERKTAKKISFRSFSWRVEKETIKTGVGIVRTRKNSRVEKTKVRVILQKTCLIIRKEKEGGVW